MAYQSQYQILLVCVPLVWMAVKKILGLATYQAVYNFSLISVACPKSSPQLERKETEIRRLKHGESSNQKIAVRKTHESTDIFVRNSLS